MASWDHWAVRRLLLVLAVLGFVTLVIVLTVLGTGDVKTNSAVSCGSLLSRVEPDPTAEEEYGCDDRFGERGRKLVVTAAVGGGLVAAMALGAVAQAAAARATARSNAVEGTTEDE